MRNLRQRPSRQHGLVHADPDLTLTDDLSSEALRGAGRLHHATAGAVLVVRVSTQRDGVT
jgi:hypothetical protein